MRARFSKAQLGIYETWKVAVHFATNRGSLNWGACILHVKIELPVVTISEFNKFVTL